MRACNTCKAEKPLAEFYRKASNADGWQKRCKDCCKTLAANYADTPRLDPERIAALRRGEAVPGGASMDEVAEVMGISRQYVGILERTGLMKLRQRRKALELLNGYLGR